MNIGLLFLETLVAVRLLTLEQYGSYVLLVAIVNFLVIAVDFGLKTGLTQLIASSDRLRQEALVNNAITFRLIIIAIVSAVIWLGQYFLSLYDPSQAFLRYAHYLPLMLLVASADELLFGMLRGFQSYLHMAVAQIVRSLLRLGLTIIFLSVLKLGVTAVIYAWIISFSVSVMYQYVALPITKQYLFHPPLLGQLLRFSLPLQLSSFLWFIFSAVQVVLLGTLAGPTSVAYYAVAVRIPDALQRLSESYIAVYFPTMAALLGEGNNRQASWIFGQSLRLLSFAAALVALTAVVFSSEIVTALFSEQYAVSSPAFALLMLAFPMLFILNLMGYTLTAAGYPQRSLVENFSRTILTILANLLLIPIFGFMGSVYATLGAGYSATPLAVWLLRRSRVAVIVAPYMKQTALLLLCAGLFWWVQPAQLMYRIVFIMLFVILNGVFATISRKDLSLVLPGFVTKRLGLPTPYLTYDH